MENFVLYSSLCIEVKRAPKRADLGLGKMIEKKSFVLFIQYPPDKGRPLATSSPGPQWRYTQPQPQREGPVTKLPAIFGLL